MTSGQAPRRKRRTQSAPTVADVARAAGVSLMTVSRVINAEPNVLEATRTKVRAAVEQLGYVPNLAARSLAGAAQCRIALLFSNPSAAYLSELLVGVLAEAAAQNAELTVEPYLASESVAPLVARLVRHRIDAVVLPPPLCEDTSLLDALQAAGLALVQIASGSPAALAHAVTIDDEAAACAMVRRLEALGHRRIALITGDANQASSAMRLRGYEQAIRELGLPVDPTLIVAGDFTYRSGLAAAEQLLSLTPRPTAIFASNDDMAAAAVSVAHRLGLEIPRDLTVCGYDDTTMATTIWPELTTIRQPIAEMARQAVRLLVDAIKRRHAGLPAPLHHIQLDFELILRGSHAGPLSAA
ncbi:LacI family transcriptional regulator [Novosphingobium chloroacetimidivorans]|uniref:LacI family transcriptional regulator n=1 Tax=Novosphingobium chloroacetimidivorans TaxID=1428314 RepID=A0A7W7KED9_9SPHN|nr:LacI family DNA-binding transcriptional regulator [Novosphingobium chloroacetimidivorans]MBB4860668.1 LacI family transcriptional regulator [Novosphingobium chloroacetimidivorans]